MPTDTNPERIVRLLEKNGEQLLTIESCTAGRMAATLSEVPGVSSHLVGSLVTYQNRSKAHWLGLDLAALDRSGAVSPEVALQMAERGLRQTPHASLALSITGHLGPNAPADLDGVAYATIAHRYEMRPPTTFKLDLKGKADSRIDRQLRATHLALGHLQKYLSRRLRVAKELASELSLDHWQQLLASQLDAVGLGGPSMAEETITSRLIFPGSFNPLHQGHRQMIEAATTMTGQPVELLMSIDNVDKPSLTRSEVLRRVLQFAASHTTWVVKPARFWEWATIFPGATFVVGLDTLERIVSHRYASSRRDHEAHLQTIVEQGCQLLVFGRLHQGEFRSATQIKIPKVLRDRVHEIPEAAFRCDAQSRLLRSEPTLVGLTFPPALLQE